jgi:hypothetical protein
MAKYRYLAVIFGLLTILLIKASPAVDISSWSTTAATNASSDSDINWAEGQNPSTVNNSARAMMAKLAQYAKTMGTGYITTAGTEPAYTLAPTHEPSALANGWAGIVKFHAANSGAATFKVGALAAADLMDDEGNALSANEIDANDIHLVVYDTTRQDYLVVTLGADTSVFPTLSGNNAFTGANTFTNDTGQTLISTDAGATAMPFLYLYRNSATPAASDEIGALVWQGEDSAGNTQKFAGVHVVIDDATSTSEDATLAFNTFVGGSDVRGWKIAGGLFSASSSGDEGSDSINLNAAQGDGYKIDGNTVQNGTECTLTDGANISWDLSDCPTAKVTLGGDRTLDAPTNMMAGGTYILRFIQDATGSRDITFAADYEFPGGSDPVQTEAANSIDIMSCYSDGTDMFCNQVSDFQ